MAGWIVVIVIATVVVVPICLWRFSKDLVDVDGAKDRHEVKTANRDLLVKIAGAVGLVATLVLALQSYKASQEGVRISQEGLRVAQDTLRTSQQGQAADRYTKAVEQLGSDNDSVQIGGIATLKSLLSNADHHNAAVDVLAAFVRTNAKPPPTPLQLVSLEKPCDDRPPVQPPLDVQAAMFALAERDPTGEHGRLDLRGAYLAGLELPIFAKLNGVLLDYANLSYARLEGVDLELSSLRYAQLPHACLLEARMQAAATDFTNLEHAVLNGADLRGSVFRCANLRRAGLIGAKLSGLSHSQLQEAVLEGAHLEGSILDRVDMTGAYFTDAHLEGASLEYSNGVTEAQLRSAHTDANTKLPNRTEPWPTDCD